MDINTMLNGNTDDPLKHAVGLSAVWQKCMSELYQSDCRVLIPKEHGQLGKLKNSLGMTQAAEVVAYAIRNWDKFTQEVAKQVEKDVLPLKPSVGWLCQYHAIAVLMLHEELQSAAKKKAAEEQAVKEAQAKEGAKALQELKSKEPSVTLLQLTPDQLHAYFYMFEDPINEAWVDRVSEKYGEWRPDEKGIPCDVALKKAG